MNPREAVLYAMRLLRESNPSPAALAEIERVEQEWITEREAGR